MAKIRLFIDHPLAEGQGIPLNPDQAHYLASVIRQEPGRDRLSSTAATANGWRGSTGWPSAMAICWRCARPRRSLTRPTWLIFAPIKARTDFIVEKAAGWAPPASCRCRPTTQCRAHPPGPPSGPCRRAAEQSGGTFVPEVGELTALSRLLDGWDAGRHILWADEALAGPAQTLRGCRAAWAILIGPEGGWSDQSAGGFRPWIASRRCLWARGSCARTRLPSRHLRCGRRRLATGAEASLKSHNLLTKNRPSAGNIASQRQYHPSVIKVNKNWGLMQLRWRHCRCGQWFPQPRPISSIVNETPVERADKTKVTKMSAIDTNRVHGGTGSFGIGSENLGGRDRLERCA